MVGPVNGQIFDGVSKAVKVTDERLPCITNRVKTRATIPTGSCARIDIDSQRVVATGRISHGLKVRYRTDQAVNRLRPNSAHF